MAYATIADIQARSKRVLSDSEVALCETLLEDAGVIIDSYNENAPQSAKKVVSCTMVIRSLGDGENVIMPIGATQGTISAGGYSQSFTMGNGSSGELYITKLERRMLHVGNRAGTISPWEDSND